MDFAVRWMVFLKTRHTLDFCFNETKMEWSAFYRRAPAQFLPFFLDESRVDFRNLPESNPNTPDALL
jgi:hypothetical protein